jgi:hypothetical protein
MPVRKPVPVRVNLKLHPHINKRLEDVTKKMIPSQTKQRYIEEAIIRRLSQDWKTI